MNWTKIWLLIRNMDCLWSLSPKMAKFLWNECPILIYRIKRKEYGCYTSHIDTGEPKYIVLGDFPNKKEMYTALLHEVGHYKDSLVLKHRFNTAETKRLEKSAWKHALRFSQKYEIPIDVEIAQKWLATYGTEYRCLDNKVLQNEMGTRKTGNRL